MDTGESVRKFQCRSCGARLDPDTPPRRCPECRGILTAIVDYDSPGADRFDQPASTMWDFDALLPYDRDAAISMEEGGTPLVSTPKLPESFGVDRLLIKDEGQNPTGSVADRGMSVAVTAATQTGASKASLAAPGASGQSFAAYTARAGLDGVVYLPSRAPFERKAMSNVHGVDLTVVQGRLPDAETALQTERDRDNMGYPLGAFETPFRHLGATTIAFEIVTQMDDSIPDAIIVPTGSGVTLVGLYEGLMVLKEHGVIADVPRLLSVQPEGCAPIAEAARSAGNLKPVNRPDTVCGELEVPDPPAGDWVLEAIEQTGGTAVALPDDEILETGVTVARETGLELSPNAAAAPAGIRTLRKRGVLDESDTVVVVGTGRGGADLLRSHLEAKPR